MWNWRYWFISYCVNTNIWYNTLQRGIIIQSRPPIASSWLFHRRIFPLLQNYPPYHALSNNSKSVICTNSTPPSYLPSKIGTMLFITVYPYNPVFRLHHRQASYIPNKSKAKLKYIPKIIPIWTRIAIRWANLNHHHRNTTIKLKAAY